MRETKGSDLNLDKRISVSAETLAKLLDCGRATAVKVGTECGARMKIGGRVLFRVDKIKEYLDQVTEPAADPDREAASCSRSIR